MWHHIDYKRIFDKFENPLRRQEHLTEETYKVYYVDESGNKHGSEKIYRSGVGDYPGGYCWDDLELSRIYEHGSEIAEYNHCNNHKKKTDIYIAKEYDNQSNTSIIVYYDYKYIHNIHDYKALKCTEYLHEGHYSTFVKESHTGLVFFWEKTSEVNDESVLIEKCEYLNGQPNKTLTKYYKNGYLKQDHSIKYNYTFSGFSLKQEREEYYSRDSSGNLEGTSYKYLNGLIQEQTDYVTNKKHGTSKFYAIQKDTNKLIHEILYAEGKEVKRTSYPTNVVYNYDIKNNVSIIKEYKRHSMTDYSKMKEYTISGYYLDISNHTPYSLQKVIKHGSYMEWYCHTDALFLMLHYENGHLNGPCRSFYADGTPNVSGNYKDHKKSGIFTYCDQKGNKKYFNHDTGQQLDVIDLTEQYRGTSEFDSHAFAYSNFETGSSLL